MKKGSNYELLKFYTTGGIEAIVGLLIIYILKEIGMWYLMASIIVDILNLSLGFIMKKFWVFKGEQLNKTPKQILLSVITFFIFLIISAFLMYIFVHYVQIQFVVAKIIIAIILSIISYFLNKKVIFNK